MKTAIEKKWEIKDRTYLLLGDYSPLTFHVSSGPFIWFDEEKGINREILYSPNQKSLFVDEQDGHVVREHIVFEDGTFYVPKNKPLLQQFLTLFHTKKHMWEEVDMEKEAADEVDLIEKEIEAFTLIQELDIDHLEAIMRTELGSSVTSLSTKELKRDAYRFAKENPVFFIELSQDEDLKLRNLANRAVEANILKLTDDNTVFKFATNGKKVMTVPFDQHPYASLAQYFKTDEGVDLMKSIIKKLS